jgi:hypothetical protein
MNALFRSSVLIGWMSLSMLSVADAQDKASRQRAALIDIRATAADICVTVEQSGGTSTTELSAEVKAKLNGVVGRVADLGFDTAAKYKKDNYNGVLQQDLASMLKDMRGCRERVFNTLVDRMLPKESSERPTVPQRIPLYVNNRINLAGVQFTLDEIHFETPRSIVLIGGDKVRTPLEEEAELLFQGREGWYYTLILKKIEKSSVVLCVVAAGEESACGGIT